MIKYLILLPIISMLMIPQAHSQVVPDEAPPPPRDGFYERRAIHERSPLDLPYVREADILWSLRVWQRIDLRERMNQRLYFPESPSGDFRSLMQVLQDGILAGEIRAYGIDDENFRGEPLDPERLFEDLARPFTFTVEGEEFTEMVPFSTTDVYIFRIKEEWFIDKRRGKLDVRIIGISPAMLVRDEETGELTNVQEPIFWVPFEDARPVLARAPVYNAHNSSQLISFDDLFIRRFFNGTIYREDRPDNRAISEYIEDPRERLLEAERIKERIRNMELDLWHY